MFPILARTRWFFIYAYTAVLTIGVLLSIFIIYKRAGKTAVSSWFDGVLFALFGALLLGRASFIATQWDYYLERSDELGQLWQGGLTLHGAWLGGLVGIWIWSYLTKQSSRLLLQKMAPTVPLLFVFGWTACWLEGCAYGAQTTFGPFSANLPDHLGVFAVRYQAQLAGIIFNLLLLGWVRWFGDNGRLFLPLTIASFAAHGVITFIRGDTVYQVGQLRLDTVLDLGVVLLCLILLQYGRRVNPEK